MICIRVTLGEGKVHACLRANFATLSDACRKEELKLMILESSNTELMPNLARACKVRQGHRLPLIITTFTLPWKRCAAPGLC